jgi:hypothetical protein
VRLYIAKTGREGVVCGLVVGALLVVGGDTRVRLVGPVVTVDFGLVWETSEIRSRVAKKSRDDSISLSALGLLAVSILANDFL